MPGLKSGPILVATTVLESECPGSVERGEFIPLTPEVDYHGTELELKLNDLTFCCVCHLSMDDVRVRTRRANLHIGLKWLDLLNL